MLRSGRRESRSENADTMKAQLRLVRQGKSAGPDSLGGMGRPPLRRGQRQSLHGEAIEVIGESDWAGVAAADFGLGLVFFSQGAKHAMRQDQLFHLRLCGDASDDRWRHVKTPFDTRGAFGDGVVRDEQVGIRGELRQTFAVAVGVSAEDDAFAANLDAPCQRGECTVDDTHGVDGEARIRIAPAKKTGCRHTRRPR